MSSTAFLLANKSELDLMKIIIYPRTVEVLLNLLAEKGYIKNFKYSEVLAYVVIATIIVYNYLYEPMNLSQGYVKSIDYYYP